MKVMFVAANPPDAHSLELEREITELQRGADVASGDPPTFRFYPALHLEALPSKLALDQPDVLHISAHGQADGTLSLASDAGREVPITAEMLRSFLHPERPPRLVYLNACNSAAIARELASFVPMAIGTNAPITNRAAIASARLFYDRLLHGLSVDQAFDAARGMLQALDLSNVDAELFARKDTDPARESLYSVPRLVARFDEDGDTPDTEGNIGFNIGLVGCRPDTMQIVFFTDDEEFAERPTHLEEDMCLVARTNPIRGIIWTDFRWSAYGDIRLYACGTTSDGRTYAVASTLCDSLEAGFRYFMHSTPSGIPPKARQAIIQLRSLDGAGFPLAAPQWKKRTAG